MNAVEGKNLPKLGCNRGNIYLKLISEAGLLCLIKHRRDRSPSVKNNLQAAVQPLNSVSFCRLPVLQLQVSSQEDVTEHPLICLICKFGNESSLFKCLSNQTF